MVFVVAGEVVKRVQRDFVVGRQIARERRQFVLRQENVRFACRGEAARHFHGDFRVPAHGPRRAAADGADEETRFRGKGAICGH